MSASTWRSRLGTGPIAFILGNEGGDMDSVVCAFMMSHLLINAKPRMLPRLSATAPWLNTFVNHTPIPVCNFPRAEIALREDIQLAFKRAQICDDLANTKQDPNNFLFMFADDSPLLTDPKSVADLAPGDCVILVDHNIPTATQMHLAPLVRGIVDHHALSNEPLKLPRPAAAAAAAANNNDDAQNNNSNSVLEIIETIGSAASHITHLYRTLQLPLDPFQARLLLSPILLDTNNFDPKSKKAVQGDFLAREFLCNLISAYSFGPAFTADDDCKRLFKELQDARENYENLSIAHALRKDAKNFTFEMKKKQTGGGDGDNSSAQVVTMAISSWGENLPSQVLKKFTMQALLSDLEAYRVSQHNADAALAMFHKKGERHIVFTAATETAQRALKAILLESKAGIDFTDLSAEYPEFASCVGTGKAGVVQFVDSTVSRKLLTPKIQEFLKGFE